MLELAKKRRAENLPLVVAVWLGVVNAYLYVTLVVQEHWDWAAATHARIITGDAPSPYRYRILIPEVIDRLTPLLSLQRLYFLYYFAVFPLAMALLYQLLRRWYRPSTALTGILLTGAVLPLSFRDHYYQPASWLELVLMIVALRLLLRPDVDLRLYALVSVLAAANRETGILFGVLLVAVTWPVPRGRRISTALTALAPVITYGAIHVSLGSAPPAEHSLLARNLHDLPTAAVHITLFLAALASLAAIGWRQAPKICRRASVIALPYVALIGVYGIWQEVRLLVPLLPILLGLGLTALSQLDADASVTVVPRPQVPRLNAASQPAPSAR